MEDKMKELRGTIMLDIEKMLSIDTDVGRRSVNKILEEIAPKVYKVIEIELGTTNSRYDLVCQKCGKWNSRTERMGQGDLCPICQAELTRKLKNRKTVLVRKEVKGIPILEEKIQTHFPYTAKLMKVSDKEKKVVGHAHGETVPDLWADASLIANKLGFASFRGSNFFMKGSEMKKPFIYLMLNDQKLSIKTTFEGRQK